MSSTIEPDNNVIARRIVGGMKVLIDVAHAHQAGLGLASACSYFGKVDNIGPFKNYTQKVINMMTQIGFDKEVKVDPLVAILYSFVTHFDDLKSKAKISDKTLQNKYADKYFSTVLSEVNRLGLTWVNKSDFTYDGTGDDIGENTIMRGMGSWVRADGLVNDQESFVVDEDQDILESLKLRLVSRNMLLFFILVFTTLFLMHTYLGKWIQRAD
jgi:hypothetical protein